MRLGAVLKKERERIGISAAEAAERVGVEPREYSRLEDGESPAEKWGPLLARIAIELETPTARLLAESGKAKDTKPNQAGRLIAQHRLRHDKEVGAMAECLELSVEDYEGIERGQSPIEEFGPLLLRFAELIEQPVFNLFYPCGLALSEVEDYS